MWLRRLALALALFAAALLVASGLGVRLGLWPFTAGIVSLGVAGLMGLAAVVLGVVGRVWLAVVIGVAAASAPVSGFVRARSVPPIHDISTDTERPPEFVALLPLRAKAPNPPGYAGREVAEKQRQAYPDIQPLRLEVAPPTAFSKAHAAAEAMGWDIVAADAKAGRIEAVATTFWFGFKDDVVVRVTPEGAGSRIDVRSKSRVGVSDVGTNAQRIRSYQKRLQ